MALADATAALVQQVFAQLVREGKLSEQLFETIAATHDRIADEALNDHKAFAASDVALVARLILDLSRPVPPHRGLKLVRNDPQQGD